MARRLFQRRRVLNFSFTFNVFLYDSHINHQLMVMMMVVVFVINKTSRSVDELCVL